MKNKIFVFMVISSIVLGLLMTGCGSKDTDVVVPADGGDSGLVVQTPADTPAPAPSTTSMTLSESEKTLALDKLDKGERVAVSTPYKVMGVGDTYVFAVAVKNIYPKAYNFRLKPKINDAKSTGLANLIHTDDTIENWLANNRFETFSLDMQGEKVVPLIVTVGPDVAVDQKTIAGSYTFEIVFEYEPNSRFWEKYNTGEDLLVIKVKE